MQHDVIRLVRNGTKDVCFVLVRLRQHGQRLVAVAGEHDLIEAFAGIAREDVDAVRVAVNRAHRLTQAHIDVPVTLQHVYVGVRATLDHPPVRAAADLQHVVVGHELDQVARRERKDLCRGRGP